jgi:hypothetical protein
MKQLSMPAIRQTLGDLRRWRRTGQRLGITATVLTIHAPLWAAGGGQHLAATGAIVAASTEISGPFAYGASLLMITASAIAWWRNHHDMGHLGNATLGALFVSGVALGAATVIGIIPGAAGAVI